MFKLLQECEIESKFDTVTEHAFLVETTKGIVDKLFLENIQLEESAVYESAGEVYKKAIACSYRKTRESLEQMGEFGKAQATKALLQARKLLHMKPQVITGSSADIKALAIKDWNSTLKECLEQKLLKEYGLAQDATMNAAREFLGKKTLRSVTDQHTRDSVLELGKIKKRHMVKTINSMYRALLIDYKGTDYVSIEAPGKKPEVYM